MTGPWQTKTVSIDSLAAKLNELESEGREIHFVLPILSSHALVVSREAKPHTNVVQPPKKGKKS